MQTDITNVKLKLPVIVTGIISRHRIMIKTIDIPASIWILHNAKIKIPSAA